MKILLPINIDRWRSPIATLLRSCVEFNPNCEFVSFSSPETHEDKERGSQFWSLPNVTQGSIRHIFQESYDIVHIASHTPKNLMAGTLAKLRSCGETRFLYTINLELPIEDRMTAIYKLVSSVVDDYVSVSNAASTLVKLDAPDSYHGVIPNGYDSIFFEPDSEIRNDLPFSVKQLGDRPYVLNVAALEYRKHPEWIIQLARANPNINFVMAGWVIPQLGELFLSEILSCDCPNLIWLGHVERKVIRSLLRYAAVFAFPSEREGLPLSVIEAMGMGVPVIAQPKSSLPELITHDFCGKLIAIDHPNSLQQWSDAINIYLNRSQEEQVLQKSILSLHTRQLYSWESIGASYGDLYRRILSIPH
jgi:glycosyltransferase involved in cell wall biosynthesis